MRFDAPIESWLRGLLQDGSESFLSKFRLRQEGYFNPSPIWQKWTKYLSGQRNFAYYLYLQDMLMFQVWLVEQ